MAASGGNIEWSTTVKPILTALYGPFFDKNDAVEIIQAILKSETEFQNHEDIYDLFYTCFACLSSHFISVNAANLPTDQLNTARDAFRVVLRQILKKLSEAGLNCDDTATTAAPNISIKQLLLPIVGLCGIEGGGYPQADLVILTSLLKSAKLPAHVNVPDSQTTKSSVIPSPITSLASQATTTEKQPPSNAQRRSDALLEQLTTPLRNPVGSVATPQAPSATAVLSPGSKDSLESAKDGNNTQHALIDMKKWVASTCSSLLMELRAGSVLLNVSASLPCLQRYLNRWQSAKETAMAPQFNSDASLGSLLMELRPGSVLLNVSASLPCLQRYLNRWQSAKETAMAPQFNSDASLLHFLVNEVHVCRLALSLPCLEPLTSDRIATLSDVSAAWLLCATAQASLHPKDEESEQQTATLVESALSLYNSVGEIFKQSTRAGGYVYQNHLMIGGWVLLCGLHHALAGAPCPTTAPGKSPAKVPSRPYNLTKMQQGLGVVWVALGGKCLSWVGALLSDARLEALSSGDGSQATPAPLHILAQHTAHQRELRLASAAPLHQLLVALGVVCYRKATNLKRAVVQKQHQDADPDRSDSTVYFQDMILCSEDSETDDDSEPLFGLWFESTLVAPDITDNSGLVRAAASDSQDASDAPTRTHQAIVPDKAEPYSYITLATEVFTLLTEEIISEGAERLGSGSLQLHEAHQALLAALAKDLDRETARTDTGTISSCFGARLGGLYGSFSASLVRYLHNLTGAPAFASLQPALHQQLVAVGSDRTNMTPLQVGPRVVKLLGGMVLSKAAAERENSILAMWHKIVNTLQECALQPLPSQDHDYEDLNVEHAQLLVYLFHSLTLMQKKSVLLMTSNAIIKVVETLSISDRRRATNLAPHQLMLTTRLMLLLEYLMRHLYDAPQTLLQQIEWNLVIAPGLAQPSNDPNTNGARVMTENGQMKARIYCEVPYIEQAYRELSQDESSMRPKFYALTNAEINNQENPKFDGLACNFVLGTPHKLKYPLLLDALLALLNSSCVCDNPLYQTAPAALAAAHYCFQTAWRLVISMPPATPHMDKLQAGTTADLPSPLPLHAVIWAPRADNKKVFNPWLKDALVKQGMYTQYAENLLAGVSASCDNMKYTAWLASESIKHLKANITTSGLPSLLDVISCDSALVRLKMCLADTTAATDAAQFMPDLLDLMDTMIECCRVSASADLEGAPESSSQAFSPVWHAILKVCGGWGGWSEADGGGPPLSAWLRADFSRQAATALDHMSSPPPLACINLAFYASHIIPSESAVLNLVSSHCELISANSKYSIGPSLMMLAYSAAKLLEVGAGRLAESPELTQKTLDLIIPALTDGRLHFMTGPLSVTLNTLVPVAQRAQQLIHEHVLKVTYSVLVEHLQPANERTLRHIVKYWEKVLDRPYGRLAYENVFAENTPFFLGKVLLSAPNCRKFVSADRVIKLFVKIFNGCESNELNSALCISVCKFIGVADQMSLSSLLSYICLRAPIFIPVNDTPTETELPTPTSSAPEAGGNPASLALRNALRSVFRTDSSATQRNDTPAQRNDPDLPVFDTPSPAPRAQSDTAQQSESCSWSDGSKESAAAAPAVAPPTDNSPSPLSDATDNNAALLSALCKHIVQHCSEEVSERVLSTLIVVCGESACSPLLLREMCRLADAHSGADHRQLFPAAVAWLATCVETLSNHEVLEKLEEGQVDGNLAPAIESACVLLSYLTDALHAINTTQPHTWRSVSPTWESPSDLGFDLDYTDEQQDDDDTSADDSDEDAMLQYKLCTFTVTQREFMNQHWYHCHTCKMVDGVGVCTVCARVCHRGHDVSYAKFGNFFCDCGAKPDSSCQALVKRSVALGGARGAGSGAGAEEAAPAPSLRRRPSSPAPAALLAPPRRPVLATNIQGGARGAGSGAGAEEAAPAPSLRRRPSSPAPAALLAPPRRPVLATNIQGCRSYLVNYGGWGICLERVKRLLEALCGPVRAACERAAPTGAHGRAQRALAQLHLGEKKFTHTDSLMLPTLGSQEGAFENVRMSYTGENGQTIRQLMSTHKLRRVAMCCLASPQGRRQHLAVSHEKGKITVLQLSALLKQADSSKHKLTLTRLSSAPIPFTVLSLSGNPWNEDLLAVCGLKECHVLTFNSGGAVADHLVLNTALEGNNYVIKAIWLPGSQTQLALVTSDFVKIFDLSKDLNNPMHHFLVPSGKVRDVTFVNQDGIMHMLCMSSAGHIYWQPMSEESRATLGTFYVTNTLEVLHPEIQDVAGLVGGGGVSIYYSHTLKMLFFSYAQGKSFLAPLNTVEDSVKGTAMITLSALATQKEGGGRGGKQGGVQSLCQWAEVPGHPGLVTAVMQASNNPVVLMLTPNNIYVQEIKVVPAKAKITDMVAVRHWCGGGGEQKSTLILLCEDGSLRMYAASGEHTGYWLAPAIQPTHAPRRRPRLLTHHAKGKAQQATTKSNSNGTPQFPIDFFEHCVAMTDIEFGGNDLLQVYNTAQIKHRLNTTGLYVVSTKMSGFTMEVVNSDPNMVICGIRVLLGSQDVARTPSYVEIYGRTVQTIVVRNRWFDIPLTREESLNSDKKLTINFGPSQDPDGVTMVDSVKVYGKNKEQFGWPEENEDPSACPSSSKVATEAEGSNGAWKPSSLERLACAALEALELGAGANSNPANPPVVMVDGGGEAAKNLLCAPASAHLHARVQCLLRALHHNYYHQYKDQAILKYVCTSLKELRDTADARNIDPEAYFRLVLLARGVAVARPHNLVTFTAPAPPRPANGDWSIFWRLDQLQQQQQDEREPHLCALLTTVLWRLAGCKSGAGPPGILQYGLRHAEHTLHALADTVHAFQLHADPECVEFGNQIYLSLLLAEDQSISFGAKAALMRVLRPRVKRRRVYIPSPPNTPGAGSSVTTAQPTSSITEAVVSETDFSTNRDEQQENQFMEVDDSLEPMVLLAPDGGLEALLDIPPDADDETMVELAIALSLQEQPRRTAPAPTAPPPPAPAFGDATHSPAGSDDEGSTAATDGSTLRTSPAEAPGSAGSESNDSIGGVSGRSSAYGEMSAPPTGSMPASNVIAAPVAITAGPSTSSSQPVASTSRASEAENETRKLHALRLSLLSAALDALPTLRTLPGVRAIPFVQVVLMLAGDLDSSVEGDRAVLERLLELLVAELDIQNDDATPAEERTDRRELQLAIMRLELLVSELDMQGEETTPPVHERTNRRELQLVIMRLLSVLMARWKTSATGGPATRAEVTGGACAAHVSRLAAAALVRAGAPHHCYRVLSALLPYWKEKTSSTGTTPTGQQLLKPLPPQPLPDMQPFFVKEYVKSHALDVFDNYPQLLMEMALRLPCQIHKHCDPAHFDARWRTLLCEYMMNQQTPLRKQVRKLLLLLCGTRERYRQLRDVHALDTHLNAARALLTTDPAYDKLVQLMEHLKHALDTHLNAARALLTTDPAYDKLVQLMEHLKACAEIVSARTGNWQHTCAVERREALAWLVTVARRVHPHVAPTVLQLLQAALCAPPHHQRQEPKPSSDVPERERSADSDAYVSDGSKFQEQRVPALVQQILKQVSQDELRMFVKAFLLETNSTAVRWQAHALLLAIYNNSSQPEQATLVSLLWGIWPTLPQYGRKAAQFVDLLGYFTLKTPNIDTEKYVGSAVELLRNQNLLLSSHGNAALYAALGAYVELDGYYLESEPCLVCNNPELPMATIKLPTIKIDSKFTTTTQIVKLVNSHMISRISLRIGDIKRNKMVRTINFYYNNRTVQAVQELKNKPGMWHKAKRVQLQSGQSEVRVDFPLPIVACNLMMEYADFYENQQATGESLQCPRCSQSVPANPGVCANCGENVFQCHKCRAINYDEKDPFLCHACGFCKYAKFDYTLTARPCCAVDTIENDEERKKMVQTIGALLDKADRVYRQLTANKPVLESLLHKISEHRLEGRSGDENSNASNTSFSGAQINRVIQTLAHKYCVDSKGHFEDLSKIIQKVLACRKELVSFDRSQSEQLKGDTLPVYAGLVQNYDGDLAKESGGGCYGCSLACAEQCLTLLRALASQAEHRTRLCRFGLVQELVQHNLHRGTPQCQEEVRALICLVTRDNLPATEQLCNLLTQRITLSLMGHAASQDHNNSVRPLVLLLGSLVKVQDSVECWEARLRCIVKLWVWCCPHLTEVAGIAPAANAILKSDVLAGLPGINTSSPNSHQFALQQVGLPCMRYMHQLMAPPPAAAAAAADAAEPPKEEQPDVVKGFNLLELARNMKLSKKSPPPPAPTGMLPAGNVVVDLAAWLAGRVPHRYWRRLGRSATAPPDTELPPRDAHLARKYLLRWRERGRAATTPPDTELPPRDAHLARKYLLRWRERTLLSHGMRPLAMEDGGWLRPVMFDPSSRIARDTACQMVRSLCDTYERTKAVLILLTSFLPEVGSAGEASEQFLQLYQNLASEAPWKQFLALRGVLQQIADLMTKEIEQLHRLEETTLTSDLAQGYALKRLTELLAMFLEQSGARRTYKGRLVGAVLGGYLSLRRLVVQRTRLTDDTQEKLLELLEEMTTGTEAETAEFMSVCIETVQKYPLHDYRTPVFIFERLCSIIYPEENDVGEFFLTLEKDPQQEDFLQGRMLGNPYSSLEPGMGPLMRDVKNKICTDCELVALLEDDNGMELLVCNKIMSLDLPVKEVYKKVWCTSGEGVDAMRVVYRMRGLLGDATEEFVETLSQTNAEAVDDEQVYRMANVLADCGGLEVMLQRLAAIQRVGAARSLCSTLLRLLSLCARVRRCVRVLTRAETRALPVLLHALHLAADEEKDMPRAHLVYQLLEIMERILSVAASESLESFLQFSLTFGGPEYVQALLNCTECPGIRSNSVALGHLTRVLAALVYGNDLKMAMLVDHFKPVLDFDRLDSEQWTEEEFRMELFCVLCANIERNSIGGTLKDYLISLGVVRDALEYIVKHAPCVKPTLVCTDSDELKEFISRPALKYILRFLTGLAADHEPTQMLVCEKVIPIVHRLEQVSSGEHVGSLAENLLEALRSQPQCAAKVQEVRDFTRQEKKRLAMAVRERQLGALGMRSNERGQVTAQCSLTQQVADLAEEAGAVCCICREGYKYQPTKVLGIYTFTKRCPVEEYEVRARKTLGYTTVSHYNIVHVECHMAAVRLARARDEWESAALQNASTRCNGLLPLWGPHVPESAFASCLARHTTYLQECTGHRDIGHTCTLHDLKLLLLRFARGRTFHDDTGGGGPLSNMQLVPALVHMALYVINTSRVATREMSALEAALGWAPARLLEAAHDAEGPLYYVTLALALYPHAKWKSIRLAMLKSVLVIAHARAVCPGGPALRALAPEQRPARAWPDYKPYALFVAIVDLLYNVMFKNVHATTVEQWPVKLAEYIRHNDEANAKAAERIVTTLTDELLPCASFAEFCDAAGFLEEIPEPDAFLQATLDEMP
ncbi:E3 ubiquitin-protein ligase UBR4 [Ostrinia nubilalis]|uniref:E3 ubiquitin-protein ligase UBR4 n=1 Tax=Ostrinia nubilalis TaxID=29057 RepID=UPI0030822609